MPYLPIRTRLIGVGAVVSILIVPASLLLRRLCFYPFNEALASAFWFDDTETAAGYSEAGFRQIRVGMFEAEVRRLVGRPLKTWQSPYDDATIGMAWTRSPHDGSYHYRAVFVKQGRVIEKVASFYVD